MAHVVQFTFSPFQENTYVVYDETGEGVIIDPGMYNKQEEDHLVQFLEKEKITPVRLINTHCHIDHIFGIKFIAEKYNLGLEIHKDAEQVMEFGPTVAKNYGLVLNHPLPKPSNYLDEGDIVEFGQTKFELLFTPGHSKGSICFYCREDKFVISGDVLFKNSIGRTDLPDSHHETLIKSIKEKLYKLDDDVTVYAGHMEPTTIGHEKRNNPYVRA